MNDPRCHDKCPCNYRFSDGSIVRNCAETVYCSCHEIPAHKPGDPHEYRVQCKVCGEYGTVQLSILPQTFTGDPL